MAGFKSESVTDFVGIWMNVGFSSKLPDSGQTAFGPKAADGFIDCTPNEGIDGAESPP